MEKKTAFESWKETGMIKGVKVAYFPIEGNGCWYGVGSDRYGYQIGKVADNGLTFEVLNKMGRIEGTAVLATRKNFRGKGYYYWADKDGKPRHYSSRGCVCGALGVSDEKGCCETYLDPSF